MEQSVVVEHIENNSWALVIVVNRNAYGRRTVVPMIFVGDPDTGDFAAAPQLKTWARAGLLCIYNTMPERREELLKNAVSEFVRQVSLRSFIKERSKVGIVARARASGAEKPIEFFGLTRESEPALFWLCERSSTAYQALKVSKFLAEKNKIGELTRSERDAIAMKNITHGETLKSPVQILNVWRGTK
jgi:hypothetical protein